MTVTHLRQTMADLWVSAGRSVIGESVLGLMFATVILAIYLTLAGILPGTWTFASDGASQLRSDLRECLVVSQGAARLACYDEVARRPPPHPAKGANAPAAAFGRKDAVP